MKLRTVGLLVTLALGILSTPLSTEAQQPAKVPRIGVLVPFPAPTPAAPSPTLEAFRQGLRELGRVEGQNIAVEYRYAEGKFERLPDLAAELVRLKVDVIVTSSDPAIRAVKQATTTIPIVMAVTGDPVGTGLVASLARPGGNITGLSLLAPELAGKRLELLKETLPRLSRVAVLWNSPSVAMRHTFREAQVAAGVLGLTFLSLEVQGNPEDFERVFSTVPRERPDGLFVTLDPFTRLHRRRIVELAVKHQLPAIYEHREFVGVRDLWRRAATYVDKILKGAKPADLPVEQPTRFELVINLKTAKTLGLTIPRSILIRADEVIQ